MGYISNAYIHFFADLSFNNNREWFHANKPRFEADVRAPFYGLVEAIRDHLLDSEPYLSGLTGKDATFRINRDIRFGVDKSPYKTHMAAAICLGGSRNKEVPGHYLHLSHNELMIGGGAYFLDKETLLAIRKTIAEDPHYFASLTNDINFTAHFGEIQGERNRRLPREFAAIQDITPYIANTQFYWMKSLPIENALLEDFPAVAAEFYRSALVLNNFFKSAMSLS